MNFLLVFYFTQFWLDGLPGNEYFWISHKISGHLTPMTPLCIRSDLKPLETDMSDSSYCDWVERLGLTCFWGFYFPINFSNFLFWMFQIVPMYLVFLRLSRPKEAENDVDQRPKSNNQLVIENDNETTSNSRSFVIGIVFVVVAVLLGLICLFYIKFYRQRNILSRIWS